VAASGWVLVGLAAGYVALALYGKYRKLKDDYHAAVDEERRKRQPPEV